jgi:hypothetical protein
MVSFSYYFSLVLNGPKLTSLCCCVELDSGSDDNPYGIAEVTRTVRIAQYLGIIVGVLSEFISIAQDSTCSLLF